jgi:UDP-N-acetyl-2-amino-2-deoxyglucuronate dehydrogenase
MPTLNYALIGCAGGIAKTHLDALKQVPGARLVAMNDVNATVGAQRAAEAGAAFYADHRELLKQTRPDVVVIVTPHPFHAAIALDAFAAGAHVLVEKPIAISTAEADAMIDAAERAGRFLGVNFQLRFRPIIDHTRQFIASGQLGELMRVVVIEPWYRPAAYYRSAGWRGTWKGEGGGILMNQAPHTLDLLCHLVGQPVKVMGWTRTFKHQIEVEDSAQAMFQFANGAMGMLQVNTVDSGGAQRLEITGDKASLVLSGDTLSITRYEPSMNVHRETSPEMYSRPAQTQETLEMKAGEFGSGHAQLHQDFFDAVTNNRPPRVDGREGRLSLELANAILLSSDRNAPVTLPLDRAAYSALLTRLQTS